MQSCLSPSLKKVDIFVSAHQDDWQLFMGRDFYHEAADTSKKIILIITTSGATDARFAAVRDSGVLASVNYVTDHQSRPLKYKNEFFSFENHRINFSVFNNITVIFFHLPDGNVDGKGFKELQYESISKFKTGEIKSISTTDSLNVFRNWQELINVCSNMVDTVIGKEPCDIYLHLPDTSSTYNPKDHPDHISTAQLALSAFENLKAHLIFYSQYQNEYLPQNLYGEDSLHQTEIFNAYDSTVTKGMGYCTTCYTDLYKKWCVRSYSRKIN